MEWQVPFKEPDIWFSFQSPDGVPRLVVVECASVYPLIGSISLSADRLTFSVTAYTAETDYDIRALVNVYVYDGLSIYYVPAENATSTSLVYTFVASSDLLSFGNHNDLVTLYSDFDAVPINVLFGFEHDYRSLLAEIKEENAGFFSSMLEKIDQILDKLGGSSSAGQDAVDDLKDAIADDSQSAMTAINNLTGAMSYEGTWAVLNIPALTIPAIGDLVPRTELHPHTSIDFRDYVRMMPTDILYLVQNLFTAALIVYCFKELYGTISYVLTLKGGGNSGE